MYQNSGSGVGVWDDGGVRASFNELCVWGCSITCIVVERGKRSEGRHVYMTPRSTMLSSHTYRSFHTRSSAMHIALQEYFALSTGVATGSDCHFTEGVMVMEGRMKMLESIHKRHS